MVNLKQTGKIDYEWHNGSLLIFLMNFLCMPAGFISLSLTSIETRYGLTAVEVGLIPSVVDIAVLITAIFISYFAGKGHKPRWLAASLLIQGVGNGSPWL